MFVHLRGRIGESQDSSFDPGIRAGCMRSTHAYACLCDRSPHSPRQKSVSPLPLTGDDGEQKLYQCKYSFELQIEWWLLQQTYILPVRTNTHQEPAPGRCIAGRRQKPSTHTGLLPKGNAHHSGTYRSNPDLDRVQVAHAANAGVQKTRRQVGRHEGAHRPYHMSNYLRPILRATKQVT